MSPVSPLPEDPLAEILSSAPTEAWVIAVKSATDIVRDVVAPLTSTTSGLGRLIQSKFDGFIELQRVLSADTLRRAHEKILSENAEMKNVFNPSVVITCMEESSKQIEHEIRDLWANLLARELTDGGIHPEMPRILARLTRAEADELLAIASRGPRIYVRGRLSTAAKSIRITFPRSSPTLSQEILRGLGVIDKAEGGGFSLTAVGYALLAAVAPYGSKDEKEGEDGSQEAP